MTQDFLTAAARGAAAHLADDLARVFGERLCVLAAYEPASAETSDAAVHTIAIVDRVTMDDLSALLTVVPAWHKAKLATPLLIGREEFERSLDVFPIEYQAILSGHVVIRGAWPVPQVQVSAADLRRACERQIKGHLIHLREAFLETHGRPTAVAALVRASVPPFRASLRHVAQLQGVTAQRDDELVAFAHSISIDSAVVKDVLAFGGAGQAADAAQLLPRYIAVTEQLWRVVDRT